MNNVVWFGVARTVGWVFFLMCVASAFVIPSPSCWSVDIFGVGAVYECPKKGLVFDLCQ